MTNFSLISKIDGLNNQLQEVSNQQHHILSNVNGQTSQVQAILTEMKEEQSWLGAIQMDVQPNKITNGQAEVTFTWQVKEWQHDSEVMFHYQYGNEKDFTRLPAEKRGEGLFEVTFPIEVTLEPIWNVGISDYSGNMEEMSRKEIEEKQLDQNQLKYFVSISSEDTMKSGEIHTQSFGDLGIHQYGIIHADLHRVNKHFNVSLNSNQVEHPTNVIEEAFLLTYKQDHFIDQEKMELGHEDDQMRFFHLEGIDLSDGMRLVIKVVYSDGKSFEKEVYSS